jgi:NDP-sugar pyrophosphorylase family protein
MSKFQLVIPMSGVGKRFKDAGYQSLKPFIEVNGKAIIEHILDMYPLDADVLFILNESDPDLETHTQILKNLRPASIVACIPEHKKGPAFAISQAREFIALQKPVIVNYADFSGSWDFKTFLTQLDEFDGNILTYTGFHPHMLRSDKFAFVKLNNSQLVLDIQEKAPFTSVAMNEHASAGAYGFKNGGLLLAAIDTQIQRDISVNGEYYTSLTYKPLLETENSIVILDMDSFNQWGTPEDLEDWIYWHRGVKNALAPLLPKDRIIDESLILLAAGKGSRVVKVANTEKPFIPVGSKNLWECALNNGIKYAETILVTRESLQDFFENNQFSQILTVKNGTTGQAASALLGLRLVEERFSPVSIFSCDNVLSELASFDFKGKRNRLVVWVVQNYPPATLRPESYSWITVDLDGKVNSVHLKTAPPDPKTAYLLIGNFSFSSAEVAIELCEDLINRDVRVNGEHYLDSLVKIELDNDRDVGFVKLNHFLALGTSEELETMRYYENL